MTLDVIRWTKTKKPTLDELRKGLKSEGFECELYSDKPKVKYGRHKHDFDDFVVIVTGKMKIATDTQEWILKPGDRLNLPANTPHTAEMLGTQEVQYLSVLR